MVVTRRVLTDKPVHRLPDEVGVPHMARVTERAALRYAATLRESDLMIESVSGPYGGYRVGRGLRRGEARCLMGENCAGRRIYGGPIAVGISCLVRLRHDGD
jgi:hypothetical protein